MLYPITTKERYRNIKSFYDSHRKDSFYFFIILDKYKITQLQWFSMLKIESLTLSPSTEILLDDCTWNIPLSHKIGLVGRNGTGKTTLIKNIMGEEIPFKGNIFCHEKLRIGYLPQKAVAGSKKPLWTEMQDAMTFLIPLKKALHEAEQRLQSDNPNSEEYTQALENFRMADGFLEDKIIGNTLHGLGFLPQVWQQPCNLFSGGWQMRIALAKILLSRPDFAILDEPTNHLDIHARKWLSDYLSTVGHGFMVVSHDRYFLDRVTDHIVEIRGKQLHHYTSNYSRFLEIREERIVQEEAAAAKLLDQKAHLQSYIDRFGAKATKARQAQSKKKQLEKLGDIQIQERIRGLPMLRFPSAPPAPTVLMKIKEAQIGWPNQPTLISHVHFEIHKSMKIAIIGPNGCGKSTFVRSLIGTLQLHSGLIERSDYLRIGVFQQDIAQELPLQETPISYLQSKCGRTPEEIRNVLGGLGLVGEGHTRDISSLSGGERTRVALSQLILEEYNFLFLDEPTNHLDVESATVLSDALRHFDGTLVVISHDRELIENCASHFVIIQGNTAKLYDTMEDWMFEPHIPDPNQDTKSQQATEAKVKNNNSLDYAQRKILSNKLSKYRKLVVQTESEIEILENEIENIDTEMNQTLPFDKIQILMKQREQKDTELEQKMEDWENCNVQITELELLLHQDHS